MNETKLSLQIALTLVPGIGPKLAKSLISYCGSCEAVFSETKTALSKIPGVGFKAIQNILSQDVMGRAEKEVKFIQRNDVSPLFYLDQAYPKRLKLCEDGPLILYTKGKVEFNKRHPISIVGTRNASNYGRSFCNEFVKDLAEYNVQVISGLAYGIDIAAHKAALSHGLPTIAVLGHGLDRVYPGIHSSIAQKMCEQEGGLITEFLSETNPDRENFPKRNRIVAGICEALVVVEAAKKGGALITAEIANSYNRDVYAVPGQLGDQYSEGCNALIKTNKAALLTGVKDLEYLLGWEKTITQGIQKQVFVNLSPIETEITQVLENNGCMLELDQLCYQLNLPLRKVIPTLLELELKGVIKSNPGKLFELIAN